MTILPDRYRMPLVLCELEGRPRREVARQLQVQQEIFLANQLLASAGGQEPQRLDWIVDQLERVALRLRFAQPLLAE